MCNNANKLESLLASSKISDMLAESKLGELIKKKEDPIEEKKHTLIFVLAIIGAIAAVAAIAYAVYRYVTPDYMDEFDDDFDDDLDEDLDFDASEETFFVPSIMKTGLQILYVKDGDRILRSAPVLSFVLC